jgi:hypothetical protein
MSIKIAWLIDIHLNDSDFTKPLNKLNMRDNASNSIDSRKHNNSKNTKEKLRLRYVLQKLLKLNMSYKKADWQDNS